MYDRDLWDLGTVLIVNGVLFLASTWWITDGMSLVGFYRLGEHVIQFNDPRIDICWIIGILMVVLGTSIRLSLVAAFTHNKSVKRAKRKAVQENEVNSTS